MRFRLSLPAVSCWIFLTVAAAGAWAQGGPDIFVTPVANAPFSGVVDIERSVVHTDGSIVNLKSIREISRDSRGRIHNEARQFVPVSSTKTPELIHIHLYDPQTRISTMLYPRNNTFRTATVNHPPSTVPPSVRFGSPAENSLPQNEFTKEEDLGIHEVEGVPARGVRESQTIPAENSDTGKEIVITDEYWYSEDLRINLLIKHNDPRTGSVTMTVTQVTRTEPDAALFEIPEGYKRTGN